MDASALDRFQSEPGFLSEPCSQREPNDRERIYQLQERLDVVGSRLDQVRLLRGFAAVWVAAALVGLVAVAVVDGRAATIAGSLAIVPALASVMWVAAVMARRTDEGRVAREIESSFPTLEESLLTAIEQQAAPGRTLGYLQREVVDRVDRHARRVAWRRAVPTSRLVGLLLATATSVVMTVAAAAMLLAKPAMAAVPDANPAASVVVLDDDRLVDVTVDPGRTEVERGFPLAVVATFDRLVPESVTLEWATEGTTGSVPMVQSLDDPKVVGRVESVTQPLSYVVKYGDRQAGPFEVTVFDYPRLERADATLRYPSYTRLEDKPLTDVRRLSAVAGTVVELTLTFNKPVAGASLVGETTFDLTVDPETAIATAAITLEETGEYELRLLDGDGRRNQKPPTFRFTVRENGQPSVKWVRPKRQAAASSLEELPVEAVATDDVGLTRAGLTYEVLGREPVEVVLTGDELRRGKLPLSHLIPLEELDVSADDLVMLHFWAEDQVAGDGADVVDGGTSIAEGGATAAGDTPAAATRRTQSDLLFVEVRPFEQSFRQVESGPSPPKSAGECIKIAEVQKQIVEGAWKVRRREVRKAPSRTFVNDTATLADSQATAIRLLEQLMGKLRDADSREHGAEARRAMQTAVDSFREASDTPTIEPVSVGLAEAQRAYQSLLRLRTREICVAKSQGGGGGQCNCKPSDLELKENRNRYEQQTAPTDEETAEQKEDRQILSRLRELARRQADLNNEIKALQSALHGAKTEQERAEIERRLKRLREQQQELVRDSEKLAERMEAPENRDRFEEERKLLDEAREQAAEAAEALKDRKVTRAAAEATRAEQAMSELRDRLQKRTSSALGKAVRNLQQQSEAARRAQQEIAEQLAGEKQPGNRQPSLRSEQTTDAAGLLQELADQSERIGQLTEAMRELVGEAEKSQPLAADALYEAIRETRSRDPRAVVDQMVREVRQRRRSGAGQLQPAAEQGLARLAKGIDEAAEKILADEADALRRAKAELARLQQEMKSELPSSTQAKGPKPGEDAKPGHGGQPGKTRSDAKPGVGSSGEPGSEAASKPKQGQEPKQGQKPKQGNKPGQGNTPGQGQGQGRSLQPSGRTSRGGGLGPESGRMRPNDSRKPTGQSPSSGGGLQPMGGETGGFMDRRERSSSPLTGEDYLDWSDRLRNVEEVLSDPDLRSIAAGVRDRAKQLRKEVKRHSAEPNWAIVQESVIEPLAELEREVDRELMRRTSKELVPIDRVPIPPQYEQQVRDYYRRLGTGRGPDRAEAGGGGGR